MANGLQQREWDRRQEVKRLSDSNVQHGQTLHWRPSERNMQIPPLPFCRMLVKIMNLLFDLFGLWGGSIFKKKSFQFPAWSENMSQLVLFLKQNSIVVFWVSVFQNIATYSNHRYRISLELRTHSDAASLQQPWVTCDMNGIAETSWNAQRIQ